MTVHLEKAKQALKDALDAYREAEDKFEVQCAQFLLEVAVVHALIGVGEALEKAGEKP